MRNARGNRRWAAAMPAAILIMLATALVAPAQEPEPEGPPSGVIFKNLLTFDSDNDGNPWAALVQGTDGNFYGTTVGTVFKVTPGGKLTTLHYFDGTDGNDVQTALVLGTDGDFYGTTLLGGPDPNASNGNGCGTIFKITPAGALTTLYSFCAQAGCTDGERPGGLVEGSDGNFYGTTEYGGTSSCFGGGCGTVFRITPNGALITLYDFSSN